MKYIILTTMYLLKEEIGNPDFLVTRMEVTDPSQVDLLPFPKYWRESFSKKLSRSKHGIAVCSLGACTKIEHPDQIVDREVIFLNDVFYLLPAELREMIGIK